MNGNYSHKENMSMVDASVYRSNFQVPLLSINTSRKGKYRDLISPEFTKSKVLYFKNQLIAFYAKSSKNLFLLI